MRHSRTVKVLRLILVAAGFVLAQVSPAPVAADQILEKQIAEQVENLLARMTLDEKIGQLNLVSYGDPPEGQIEQVRTGRIGATLNVVDPRLVARYRQAASESRLGIPLLMGLDAVDFFRIAFPPPIAWAATWRPELGEAAARAVAMEAATTGINWTFAPMVDISRDARWGRVVEGAGEDPYLASRFAFARTRGYLRGGLMPTAKHYVGYGAVEAGRDYNTALIPLSDLYDRHLPPFRAAIEAGAETVMAALNAINGVPATVNTFLLDKVLRQDLNFKGLVTSDYAAISELLHHGVATNLAEAGRKALAAGVDLDMEGEAHTRHLAAEVAAGRVPVSQIDAAVRRVLSVKFRMGLFESRPAPVAPNESETRAVARQVARESIVLLKNEAAALPISPSVKTVALIGASARSDFDDSWYGPAQMTRPPTVTLHDALVSALGNHQKLAFAPAFTDACGKTLKDPDEAVAIAQSADLVILAVSEDCEFSGEGTSRTNLDLSPAQQDMLDRLSAVGKPVVLIIQAGRPLTLAKPALQADAILFAWLPRTEGRVALAEILTGAVSPSGKLPMTFPRSVGQIPISYDVLPTSRPPNHNRYTSRYLDEDVTPLYPFGHGLSYTTFAFANLRTASPSFPRDGSILLDVDVTNTGSRPGEEVVQLYVRQPVASRSRPLRQLRGFHKVKLRPGQTETLRFELRAADFVFHDDGGMPQIEPGVIEAYVGGSSAATLKTEFRLE